MLNLLRLRRFDVLDGFVTHYQDQFEADYHHEYWAEDAFAAFYSADPEIGVLLDEWVAQMPESFAALAARGNHRYKVGQHHRGTGVITGVSPAELQAMDAQLDLAVADFEAALQRRPKLVALRSSLLHIANIRGDEKQERAQLDAALAECPLCYLPRKQYLNAITPRWGGSHERMQAFFDDEVAPLVAQNPRLAMLAGTLADDECQTLAEAKELIQADAKCDAALAFGDEVAFLRTKASVFTRNNQYDVALPYLDRALAIAPHDRRALRTREFARLELQDMLGAARDLITLRHLEPTDAEMTKQAEYVLEKLRYDGQELNKAGKFVEASDYFALGLQLAPDDKDMANREAWNQKSIGVEDAKKQLAAAPDDFALHLRVDHGLAASRRFAEVVEIWDGFIAAHPDDPRAFVERGGAKWQLGEQDAGIADMATACQLGMQSACADVPKMQSRKR